VFPPTQIIFSAISVLLVVCHITLSVDHSNSKNYAQAARDTATSRDELIELFDRMESFFLRLRTYTEITLTAEITNVIGKVMAEVLSMLAIATKEMKQGRKSESGSCIGSASPLLNQPRNIL
jgi:hypothetical protein